MFAFKRQNSQQTASLIRNTVGLVSTTCMNNIRKGMSMRRERERERENVFGSYMLYVVRIRYFYILSFYHSCPIRFLIFPCISCMAESFFGSKWREHVRALLKLFWHNVRCMYYITWYILNVAVIDGLEFRLLYDSMIWRFHKANFFV